MNYTYTTTRLTVEIKPSGKEAGVIMYTWDDFVDFVAENIADPVEEGFNSNEKRLLNYCLL